MFELSQAECAQVSALLCLTYSLVCCYPVYAPETYDSIFDLGFTSAPSRRPVNDTVGHPSSGPRPVNGRDPWSGLPPKDTRPCYVPSPRFRIRGHARGRAHFVQD